MGEIKKRVSLCDPDSGKCEAVTALFDTGSDLTLVSEKVASKFSEKNIVRYEKPEQVDLAEKGKSIDIVGELSVRLKMDGQLSTVRDNVRIAKDLAEPLIIGNVTMELQRIAVDPGTPRQKGGTAKWKKGPRRVRLI